MVLSIKDLRTVPRILSASAETWWNSSIATNVLLNTWFISKGKDGKVNKTIGLLLGMDEKGNTKLYDKAFGTLDWIKKKLEKNNYFKAQYPFAA